VRGKQLNQARIVSKNIDWPRLDVCKDALVEVVYAERYACMLAWLLTLC
jgi:hypothetical protein